jgi:hypothetical protein
MLWFFHVLYSYGVGVCEVQAKRKYLHFFLFSPYMPNENFMSYEKECLNDEKKKVFKKCFNFTFGLIDKMHRLDKFNFLKISNSCENLINQVSFLARRKLK